MKTTLIASILSLSLAMAAKAGVVYRLDASRATLKGSARAETLGEYTVVSLGSASGYVDLGSQAGSVSELT